MLTIGKLGAGQEAYYLEKVADGAEDYYSGEGEAAGRWTGAAVEALGLEGDVASDELRAMLTGRHPASGEPLVDSRGVCRNQGPVPGFDLTFSAPKSVSLLWGLGDRRAAEAVWVAHERSVDAALAYMEREACWARRGKGGATFVRGEGFIAAAFRHRASRAGDPQLHTHVLIANATRGPDGRYTRLYHPAIYDHARTAGYLYEANLRHELSRELGVRWQPVRRGIAELEGFGDAQLRRFSTRRGEILEATGGPEASRRARQTAALATRRAKDYSVSAATLAERWRDAAREVGVSREQLGRLAPGRASAEVRPPGSPSRRSSARSSPSAHISTVATSSARSPRLFPRERRRSTWSKRPIASSARSGSCRSPSILRATATPPLASRDWSARRSPAPCGCPRSSAPGSVSGSRARSSHGVPPWARSNARW